MNNRNIESLLCTLLDCGYLDLSVLDSVRYDLGEIVEELVSEGLKPNLNLITSEIFRKGASEIEDKVEERKRELEYEISFLDGTEMSSDEKEDYQFYQKQAEEIEQLNPDVDIEWFCNYLDTSIYFVKNEDVYRRYFSPAIKEVEDEMGFYFS